MGVISIVNGIYKPTYNWGGTTLYLLAMLCKSMGISKGSYKGGTVTIPYFRPFLGAISPEP